MLTPNDLKAQILDALRMYWRTRASLAYFRTLRAPAWNLDTKLSYEGVVLFGFTSGCLINETVSDALSGLGAYHETRLTNDTFLSMISRVELYISDRLAFIPPPLGPLSTQGTFGQLLTRTEHHFGISGLVVQQMNEIRARRNALVHHHGAITPEYLSAANSAVVAASHGQVILPTSSLDATAAYLSYAADVMIQYGFSF